MQENPLTIPYTNLSLRWKKDNSVGAAKAVRGELVSGIRTEC